MTRMSKQGERRNKSPRRPRIAGTKTGPKKESFVLREHTNAVADKSTSTNIFVPKVK
jgi:hypothetical protein